MRQWPTARESGRPLHKETNRSFIKFVSLTLLPQMRAPICNLFSVMDKLNYVLGGLEAANYRQTSVDELLFTVVGFDRRTQEGLEPSHQRAIDPSKFCCLTADARTSREGWDETDAHCHQLRI